MSHFEEERKRWIAAMGFASHISWELFTQQLDVCVYQLLFRCAYRSHIHF